MNNTSTYPLVYIKWVDSQIASLTWAYIEDITQEIATVETVGFVVKENKNTLTISASISIKEKSQHQAAQIITIPKCCILKKKSISF